MTEIDQLRQDIEKMEAAQKVCFERSCGTIPELQGRIRDKQLELRKLESEAAAAADPWVYAKEQVKHLSGDGKRDIYNYARHLEQRVDELEQHVAALKQAESIDIFDSKRSARQDARIADLEAQLAKRPIVWCNRLPEGDCLRDVSGHVKVYTDKEKNDCFLVRGRFEPYTGEQS